MGSPIAAEWARFDTVVARASHGKIAVVTNTEVLNRADVVTNADVVGPVIQHLGLRPTVPAIQEHVELFFYACRPRGKRPLPRLPVALFFPLKVLILNWLDHLGGSVQPSCPF